MIYIIIPVYNRKSFTKNCLEALKRQTFNDFKTVIVNDGSTDGTSEMLAVDFPDVIELKGDGNLFWTASTNLGVKYALENGATYVLTLNNDTIPFDDYIEKMLKWSRKKPDALLGSMTYNASTNEIDFIGEIIDWKNATYHQLTINKEEYSGLTEVTHFPGRGLLIPKIVFDSIGLYDQKNFPQYFADYDFTHAAVKSGYRVYCNYDAKIYVYPEESGSVQLRNQKSLKNYYSHLFGLKSASNIVLFTKYAFKNAPKKYLLRFLAIGLVKRSGGYLRDWVLAARGMDHTISN